MKKSLYTIVIILLIGVALVAKGDGVQQWAKEFLGEGEDLICQREVKGDYFFIARSENRVKTGYRLDVTSPSGTPKTFLISWRFQDEKGNYIGLKNEPDVVSQGYHRSDKSMYAEEVAYRDVFLENAKYLHVTISLKKYDEGSKSPSVGQVPDDELERVVQCKAPLH